MNYYESKKYLKRLRIEKFGIPKNTVGVLLKSIYGLKDSARRFSRTLLTRLRALGYTQSISDPRVAMYKKS